MKGDSMKILVMCDSFKGTMSSTEVNRIIKESIQPYFVHHDVLTFAISDGGEGTLDAYVDATNADLYSVAVNNPYFEPIGATYAKFNDAAMIELASAAGVNLIPKRLNPLETTTFGVGQIINRAIESGVKHIYLGLGGSATNDAGCGLVSALGVRFYDEDDNLFIPTGKSLKDIVRIDTSNVSEKTKQVSWTIVSDVKSPLYGPDGAAYVYSAQKGASQETMKVLDDGLRHFAKLVYQQFGLDVQNINGAGAAGGVGAGMAAFFDVKIVKGIDFFIDLVDFKKHLLETSLIITGEGTLDKQTLQGKVVYGVSHLAKQHNIDVIAVVGQLKDEDVVSSLPLSEIVVIHKDKLPMEKIQRHAESDLRLAMQSWAFNKTAKIN